MNYLDHIAGEIGARCGLDMTEHIDRTMLRTYAVLCLARGTETSNEDVHNAWVAVTLETQPGHTSCIPYDQLKPEVQALDEPYRDAIRQVAELEAASKRTWFAIIEDGEWKRVE